MISTRIAGIVSAVPSQREGRAELAAVFGEREADRVIKATGVGTRAIAPPGLCASDLCFAPAVRLLAEVGWAPDSIDTLLFVSQTPDYILPATSCVLHARLGLAKRCQALDIAIGCSGYVYGIWLADALMRAGAAQRVLLLAGDTISRLANRHDRTVANLFGDAGSATALEASDDGAAIVFAMGTDGSGQNELIVPAGMFRLPHSDDTARVEELPEGGRRSAEQIRMDGGAVFAFALREVPAIVQEVLDGAGWRAADIEALVFHQANELMLRTLARRIGVAFDRAPCSLGEFGNTSSASIPLTLCHALGERLSAQSLRTVLAGFGVGFSWGAAALALGPVETASVIEV